MAGGSERSSGSSTSPRRRGNIASTTYITTGGRNSRRRIQTNTNKRKQNRFLLFSFICVYFFESGLFNGIRAIQIKNFLQFSRRLQLALQVARNRLIRHSISSGPREPWVQPYDISMNSVLA